MGPFFGSQLKEISREDWELVMQAMNPLGATYCQRALDVV
jgi:hypothetical protein